MTVWEEGQLVRMQASRHDDGRGLYKVWIRGKSGQLLLGTLAPEHDGLRLYRRLSRSQLERSGCWPVTGGETVLAFSFERSQWLRETHPDRLVKDVVLRRTLNGKSVLMKRQEGGFCLAVPFEPSRPFLLNPLFCLAEIRRVEGKTHAGFCFNEEGNPLMPHNGRNGGENSGTS